MSALGDFETFSPIVEHFVEPHTEKFEATLKKISALSADEFDVVLTTAKNALHESARLKLTRLLLLELHAAKIAGNISKENEAIGFRQFVENALTFDFSDHLGRRYPPLFHRLKRMLDLQSAAFETMISRFVADRFELSELLGRPVGRLKDIALGQGDLHCGGQTVARLATDGGKLMYKPHSLRIDTILETFLLAVFGDQTNRVRVPKAIAREGYGWSAFAEHRYCDNESELQAFYRGLGHWLAVLRLLGGTDIHLENLIATGPVPVIVDAESLFALPIKMSASGYGDAYDDARALISGSVLRTGIVPLRSSALGFEGVDMSAAGALPGQQPQIIAPVMVGEGTTAARVEIVNIDVNQAQNHPSPNPNVSKYWDEISNGFLEATARLRDMDSRHELAPLLARFEGCRVRDIHRTTQAYVEIGRMLWHPASLHDEAQAIERARDLLARNAKVVSIAPSEPEEIRSEIDALRYGDVPIFESILTLDRISHVANDWRAMRADIEELTIRSALVATDLNQRMRIREEERGGQLFAATAPRAARLDERRRALVSDAVTRLMRLALRGHDGSVTWITPEITHTGWVVQPVRPDLYFGLGGIVVALAGYIHEASLGRVPEIDGIGDLLQGALQTMRAMEAYEKPDTFGGFTGYGSQIWTWLALHEIGGDPDALSSAIGRALALEEAGIESDDKFDVIDGVAGAIVPLLNLAEATGDARWAVLAGRAGDHLCKGVILDERGARWPLPGGDPIGGFAHGATGAAWALARLAAATQDSSAYRPRWSELADAAFKFQESLYDVKLGNWLDIRPDEGGASFPTWCHGSVGIGLVAADLWTRTGNLRHLLTLYKAIRQARGKWGSSHTLCHGDFSLRELLVRGATIHPDRYCADVQEANAQIISAMEEHRGMVGSLTRAAFTPSVMTGLAGAVHSLCRMHPECDLPSPLLLEHKSADSVTICKTAVAA